MLSHNSICWTWLMGFHPISGTTGNWWLLGEAESVFFRAAGPFMLQQMSQTYAHQAAQSGFSGWKKKSTILGGKNGGEDRGGTGGKGMELIWSKNHHMHVWNIQALKICQAGNFGDSRAESNRHRTCNIWNFYFQFSWVPLLRCRSVRLSIRMVSGLIQSCDVPWGSLALS